MKENSNHNLISVDLGCGSRPLNPFGADHPFGIDCRDVKGKNFTILNVDLVLEHLPFDENSVDFISAIDLLEHIPRVIYHPKRKLPFVDLFSEISRVLKPGGIFYSRTPYYPNNAAFSDPTHVNFVTPLTFKKYFDLGDNNKSGASMYGYTGTLLQECQFTFNNSHLSVFFRKKDLTDSISVVSSLVDVSPWSSKEKLAQFVTQTTRKTVPSDRICFI